MSDELIGIVRKCNYCNRWLSIDLFSWPRGRQCSTCASRPTGARHTGRVGTKARAITLTNKGREAIGIVTPAA